MKTFVSLVFFLIICCHKVASQDFVLIDKQKDVVIILPQDATKNECKAAQILQQYLQKITDKKFNISTEDKTNNTPAIFIGKTEFSEKYNPSIIKNDGFFIATDNENLTICGGSGKGIIYGVYTFLENYLGGKKYDSSPAIIKKQQQISLKQHLFDLQNPQFIYRQSYYPNSNDSEYLDWHKLQNFTDLWGLWGHSFFKIISPDEYFITHPEYFSLVNGVRQPFQLCLSNKEVLKFTINYFRKAIEKNPDATYWSVSANDNNGLCTCENCQKLYSTYGGNSGSLIYFVNEIAKKFPQNNFTTLAYNATAKAPKIKPLKNVYIFLSSIEAKRNHPLSTELTASTFRNNLNAWHNLTTQIFIWDYSTQFTNYLTPFPYYNQVGKSVEFLAQNDVKGVFIQGSGDTYSDLADYNSYLQAKLLWNPNADAEIIKNDFINGYYGPASAVVKQYVNLLSNNINEFKTPLDIYDNPIKFHHDYLSPTNINDYAVLLDKAFALTEDNSIIQKRIMKLSLSLEYTVLQQSKFFGADKFGYLVQDENTREFKVKDSWQKKINNFVSHSKDAVVTELSEDGISPDEYNEEWKEILEKPIKTNKALGASVNLKFNYSDDYPAKGSKTLIDNTLGYKDYSYNWLYFYGKDLIATIDLKKSTIFNSIETHFLNDQRHYIFTPTFIEIEISDDGQNFKKLHEEIIPPLSKLDSIKIENFQFYLPKTEARYIRLSASCLKDLPWWVANKNRKAALCCDEIFVL